MDYKNSSLVIDLSVTPSGRVGWRSPSNIAVIKYWGKYGMQLPQNPSISFTLENAYTETTILYEAKKSTDSRDLNFDFYFNQQKNEPFKAKVQSFLESILDIFPFLKQLHLTINTKNSFPHSAGIASSASSMSALALCLCSLEKNFFNTLSFEADFYRKASYVARLGSGSACRSIYSPMAVWGENSSVEEASDLYAVPFDVHEVFKTFHDDILIVSRAEKSVSSRIGHNLMEGNIYAQNRYTQAKQRFINLITALKEGDIHTFGQITESEALTLHALMMTSNPPYILMKPNTLAAIEKIKAYRNDTKQPLFFSLDAGPNLHLLYPDKVRLDVLQFIKSELIVYCENGLLIEDKVGKGPVEL